MYKLVLISHTGKTGIALGASPKKLIAKGARLHRNFPDVHYGVIDNAGEIIWEATAA